MNDIKWFIQIGWSCVFAFAIVRLYLRKQDKDGAP